MPLILPGNVASATASTTFSVANSCRFNSADNAYMGKTSGSNGTSTSGTFSCWVKRGNLGVTSSIMSQVEDGSNFMILRFTSGDALDLRWRDTGSGTDANLTTTQLFRDPSAWMNIVVKFLTSDGTEANRVKIYINGTQVTSFSSSDYPTQNDALFGNVSGEVFRIGDNGFGATGEDFDGYMAEVVWLDGTSTTASDFGEFDEDSPTIWKPINVSGLTFGTNGFYLDFEDSSNLGNDVNGGTDLTEVALAATDQCTDTPTNSFCTMNPLDNYYAGNTYSEGNTKFVTRSSGGFAYGTPTVALSSGKWYVEFDCIASDDDPDYHQVGIVDVLADSLTGTGANIGTASGETEESWGYMSYDGRYRHEGYTTYGDSWAPGDIIGVYLDLDNNKLYFSKNGTIQNSGTGISITDPASTQHGYYYITAGGMSTNAYVTFEANFGNPYQALSSAVADANGYGQFEYDPSDGGSSSFDSAAKDFLAICTKNLAEYG